MEIRKQHKTQEEKDLLLEEAVKFFRWLVTNKAMGNVTFPLYDGIVGRVKLELYVDASKVKRLQFRGEGEKRNANV